MPCFLLLLLVGLAAPAVALAFADYELPDTGLPGADADGADAQMQTVTPQGWPAAISLRLPGVGTLEAPEEVDGAAIQSTLRWIQPDYWDFAETGLPAAANHIHRITAGWSELPMDFDYAAEPDWEGLERLSHESIGGNFDVFYGELPAGPINLDGREWRFAEVNVYNEAPDWDDPQDRLTYYSSKFCFVTIHEGRALWLNCYFSFFREYDALAQLAWCEALLEK